MRRSEKYNREIINELKRINNSVIEQKLSEYRGTEYLCLSKMRRQPFKQTVKSGFSFYRYDREQILKIWDELWWKTKHFDVMSAALCYYDFEVRKAAHKDLWPVVSRWLRKIDNWGHCDSLGYIYSHILEKEGDHVYNQLLKWSRSRDLWVKRISLVSTIHYTGKNAVFLEPEKVTALCSNCLDDDRKYLQKALGWVLREMRHKYPKEIDKYLKENCEKIKSTAFSRAIERMDDKPKNSMRKIRVEKMSSNPE